MILIFIESEFFRLLTQGGQYFFNIKNANLNINVLYIYIYIFVGIICFWQVKVATETR